MPYTTTLSAASAASDAILSLHSRRPAVRSLQEWHAQLHGETLAPLAGGRVDDGASGASAQAGTAGAAV